MERLLALTDELTPRSLTAGDTLLTKGSRSGQLYVLLDGELRIEKGGVPITSIRDRGACVGEMSLLLDIPATSDVIAATDATVAVVDDAAGVIAGDSAL